MADLFDVTRLFDAPAVGTIYTPAGSGGSASFGYMQDGISANLQDPTQVQAGDTVTWGGVTYEVTSLQSATVTATQANGGVIISNLQSYVIGLTDPTDPANTMWLWLPIDQSLLQNVDIGIPQLLTQGVVRDLSIQALTPITSIPYSDIDQNEDVQTLCFTAGTRIVAEAGEVVIDDLTVGDLVATCDAGLQPVRWIGRRHLDAATLARHPQLRPVRIRAGALGAGIPTADLVVSPQHRVLVRSKIAQRMFGVQEVLVAAKQLLALDGIEVAEDLTEVIYVHMLFDAHQVVIANGTEAESLYTGPQALRSVGAVGLEEIFAIFPQLRHRHADEAPDGARRLLTGRQGRNLAHRHLMNRKPVVMAAGAMAMARAAEHRHIGG